MAIKKKDDLPTPENKDNKPDMGKDVRKALLISKILGISQGDGYGIKPTSEPNKPDKDDTDKTPRP